MYALVVKVTHKRDCLDCSRSIPIGHWTEKKRMISMINPDHIKQESLRQSPVRKGVALYMQEWVSARSTVPATEKQFLPDQYVLSSQDAGFK